MSSVSYLSSICFRVRRQQSEHASLALISTYPSNATTNTGPTRTLRRLSSSPPGNRLRCRSTCRSSNCFRFTPLRCGLSYVYVYSFLYTGTLVGCPYFDASSQYSINKSKALLGFVGPQWEQNILAQLDSVLNKWADSVPDHRKPTSSSSSSSSFLPSALLLSQHA